jgi:hypothetical protein
MSMRDISDAAATAAAAAAAGFSAVGGLSALGGLSAFSLGAEGAEGAGCSAAVAVAEGGAACAFLSSVLTPRAVVGTQTPPSTATTLPSCATNVRGKATPAGMAVLKSMRSGLGTRGSVGAISPCPCSVCSMCAHHRLALQTAQRCSSVIAANAGRAAR